MRTRRTDHVEAVLEYIIDSECDDFSENPSSNHVYFHAYAARNGIGEALKILSNTELELSKLNTCPKCGSDNIANEGPSEDSQIEITCHDCSNQWTEKE